MIEIFLALVAANRKGWGWYAAIPLTFSFCCTLYLILGSKELGLLYLIGYFLALVILMLMCVIPKSKFFRRIH